MAAINSRLVIDVLNTLNRSKPSRAAQIKDEKNGEMGGRS